jgi:CarD family transcriptional regulator, regulator of rRNA transcription
MAVAAGALVVSKVDVGRTIFGVGDPVVSPAHGLGEVVAIEQRDVCGERRSFYVIVVRDTGIRMVVPVETAQTAGLRRPIDRKTANSLLDVFKERRPAVTGIPWSRRHRHYQQLLHSGSAAEVAKVMRDLLRLRSRKELSFGERKLLDSARRMLVKEVALACGDTEAKVERRFEKAIGLTN